MSRYRKGEWHKRNYGIVMIMNVELIAIDSLKAAGYNARTMNQHDFESLQRSIDEFGFVDPAIVNKRNNTIVGGHMRVNAARELGYETVPVVYVDLDEQKEKSLNIALNKITGEFDNEMLDELLRELDDESRLLTGFSDDEILKLADGEVDFEDKPKTTRYTIDELRHKKDRFKSASDDHSADAFINWLASEDS